MAHQHTRSDPAAWPKQTVEFAPKRAQWGPDVEVIETTLLLPIDLFQALEATARQHQLTVGQMTRVMIGLCVVSTEFSEIAEHSKSAPTVVQTADQ